MNRKNRLAPNLPVFPKKSTGSSLALVTTPPEFPYILFSETPLKNKNAPESNSGKNVKSPKLLNYKYMKFNEILQLYPLSSTQMVSIYGIILTYTDGILSLMDETVKQFRLYPNIDSDSISFKPGDIIRIHRLALNVDMTRRSTGIKNIVIFESFCDEIFKPYSIAKSPTYEDYDHSRIKELTDLSINNLVYEPLVKNLESSDVIQASFQVFDILDLDNRTVVCCWIPGKLTQQYRCHPFNGFKIERILEKMKQNQASHLFTEELIRKLYYQNMLIYIIVFGQHRATAKQLKTSDIIVVYNLIRKVDGFYPGTYAYLLYDGSIYGQCIRIAEYNSLIAKIMRQQIEKYITNPKNLIQLDSDSETSFETEKKVLQKYSMTSNRLNQFDIIKNRSIIHNNTEPTINKETVSERSQISSVLSYSFNRSKIEDRTDLVVAIDPKEPLDEDYSSEELIIINEHLKVPPVYSNVTLIDSINDMKLLSIGTRVRVEAKVYTYFGQTKNGVKFFDRMESLQTYAMIVKCQKRQCSYWQSFDSYRKMTIGSIDTSQNNLRCPQCHSWTCTLCLDISLIIQDKKNQLLDCRWTDLDANRYFHLMNKDLNNSDHGKQLLFEIRTILKYLWNISRTDGKIFWTLLEIYQHNESEYRIVDVEIIP